MLLMMVLLYLYTSIIEASMADSSAVPLWPPARAMPNVARALPPATPLALAGPAGLSAPVPAPEATPA
ncbi:hypothetical protein [Luteimonas suaedae]|uniref:hypothetical protein n=1 Tax=Luteimonas suaedae TaxID=2605430 RepID=UPI0011EDE0E6|nr:hypothetical protein [Luteimonas suaedae]